MAFIVEDGAGLVEANAYCSVEFVDSYHTDRGRVIWAGDLVDKQTAIVRATDHVDRLYGNHFRGNRRTQDQALAWPRIDAFDDDDRSIKGVPADLKKAIAEYALYALLMGEIVPPAPLTVPSADMSSESYKPPEQGSPVGDVGSLTEVLGPLSTATVYRDPASGVTGDRDRYTGMVSSAILPQIPAADIYLEKLVTSKRDISIYRG